MDKRAMISINPDSGLPASHGSVLNDPISRRKFIKRTGGTAAAGFLALQGFRMNAWATGGSATTKEWALRVKTLPAGTPVAAGAWKVSKQTAQFDPDGPANSAVLKAYTYAVGPASTGIYSSITISAFHVDYLQYFPYPGAPSNQDSRLLLATAPNCTVTVDATTGLLSYGSSGSPASKSEYKLCGPPPIDSPLWGSALQASAEAYIFDGGGFAGAKGEGYFADGTGTKTTHPVILIKWEIERVYRFLDSNGDPVGDWIVDTSMK